VLLQVLGVSSREQQRKDQEAIPTKVPWLCGLEDQEELDSNITTTTITITITTETETETSISA
jgi:hypothetical protein